LCAFAFLSRYVLLPNSCFFHSRFFLQIPSANLQLQSSWMPQLLGIEHWKDERCPLNDIYYYKHKAFPHMHTMPGYSFPFPVVLVLDPRVTCPGPFQLVSFLALAYITVGFSRDCNLPQCPDPVLTRPAFPVLGPRHDWWA
jgi:hypothetical protein